MFGEDVSSSRFRSDELAMQNLLTIINTPVIWESLDEPLKNDLIRVVATYTKVSVQNALRVKPFNDSETEKTRGLFT